MNELYGLTKQLLQGDEELVITHDSKGARAHSLLFAVDEKSDVARELLCVYWRDTVQVVELGGVVPRRRRRARQVLQRPRGVGRCPPHKQVSCGQWRWWLAVALGAALVDVVADERRVLELGLPVQAGSCGPQEAPVQVIGPSENNGEPRGRLAGARGACPSAEPRVVRGVPGVRGPVRWVWWRRRGHRR